MAARQDGRWRAESGGGAPERDRRISRGRLAEWRRASNAPRGVVRAGGRVRPIRARVLRGAPVGAPRRVGAYAPPYLARPRRPDFAGEPSTGPLGFIISRAVWRLMLCPSLRGHADRALRPTAYLRRRDLPPGRAGADWPAGRLAGRSTRVLPVRRCPTRGLRTCRRAEFSRPSPAAGWRCGWPRPPVSASHFRGIYAA